MIERKPLTEMTDREILDEITKLRERRATARSSAIKRSHEEKAAPSKARRPPSTIGDDLEALLG